MSVKKDNIHFVIAIEQICQAILIYSIILSNERL